MVDTIAARSCATQQVNYERFKVTFSDAGIAAGVQVGTIGLRAMITGVHVSVETAFNAGTTNVLLVGTTLANANELVASGDVTGGSAGYTNVTRGRGTALTQAATGAITQNGQTTDTTKGGVGIFVKYTQTGTAATAGSAVIGIEYIPEQVGF